MINNKIIIICWFDSNNKYNCIEIVKNILNNLDYDVELFPFMQIKNNNKNYLELFDNKITNFDPKYLLFWNWASISGEELKYIKNRHYERIFMIYNWDDPHCWNKNLDHFKYYDISFSTCLETLNKYKSLGIKICKYLLPGYSPLIHYNDLDDKYKCDISFICTNLYENTQDDYDEKILINRKDLIIALDKDPKIKFNFYGPEKFKHLVPSSYKGFIPHDKNRLVFSNSKINLNIHGSNGTGYLNERTILIMGSGGLMLIDNVKGIDKNLIDGKTCIIIKNPNIESILNQIHEILDTKWYKTI